MTWIKRIKRFLYYYWGTHDNKFVVDHNGNKIVFLDNSWTGRTEVSTSFTERTKPTTSWTERTKP
jgi:hypothetical protein